MTKVIETSLIIFASGAVLIAQPQMPYWDFSNGPYMARKITDLSIGYTLSNTPIIYAVNKDTALAKTTNEGVTWDILSNGSSSQYVNCVVTNRDNPNIVYKGVSGFTTTNGVLKSTNGGISWITKNNGLPSELYPSRLGMFPTSPDYLLLGTDSRQPGTECLFKSTDAGNTWFPKNPVRPDMLSVTDFSFTSNLISWVCLSADWSSDLSQEYRGVWRSTDYGETWEHIGRPNHMPYSEATCVAMVSENVIFAGFYALISSWPPVWFGGVHKTINGGQTWEIKHSFYNLRPTDIVVDPNNPLTVYMAIGGEMHSDVGMGVLRSTDGGETWSPYNNGLRDLFVQSLGINKDDPNRIYAGTMSSFYLRPSPDPAMWEERVHTLFRTSVGYIFPRRPAVLTFSKDDYTWNYQTTSQHTVQPWSTVNVFGFRTKAIDIRTGSSQEMLRGCLTAWYDPPDSIKKSIDGGFSWYGVWGNFYINTINYSPTHPDRVYAGTGYAFTVVPYLWCSYDAGETWQMRSRNWYFETNTITTKCNNPDFVYFGDAKGNYGVYYSPDAGNTVYEYNEGFPIQPPTEPPFPKISKLTIDPSDKYIYVATNQGLWRREVTGGAQWTRIGEGVIQQDSIVDIDVYPSEINILYCATEDLDGVGHIYTSPDYGATWLETYVYWPLRGILDPGEVFDLASNPNTQDTVFCGTSKGAYYYIDNYVSGTLTENTTLGPGDYIVTGDITVPSGITLTIQPNTNFYFTPDFDRTSSGYNINESELIVQGTLNAIGSQTDSVRFLSLASIPEAGDWYGIRADVGSNITISYARIKDAYAGIECKTNNLSVSYCTITGNEVYGMRFEYCTPTLISCNTLSANKVYGMFAFGSTLNLTGDRIEQSSGYGINLRGASSCYFHDDPSPRSNVITGLGMPGNYGIYCHGSGISTLTDYGHTYVENFGQAGICCTKFSSPTISNFYDIRLNYLGLYCTNSSNPTLRGTQTPSTSWFMWNCSAIWAEGYSRPNLGEYPSSNGYNHIVSSTFWHVYYDDSPGVPLMAEMNWWGDNPPDPEKFCGNIDYDPWLTSPGTGGPQSSAVSDIAKTAFYRAMPNPFSQRVIFRYDIANKSHVSLRIYNILGKLVRILDAGVKERGCYTVNWNGLDGRGRHVSSGVYFCAFEAGEIHRTQKIVLTR